MARYELTSSARRDLVGILAWSEERHGAAARRRYERLLITALLDVAADPSRPGAQARPEISEGVFTYHLRHSRERGRGAQGFVREPRHFLIYRRVSPDHILVLRVLHDAMDLARHVAPRGERGG